MSDHPKLITGHAFWDALVEAGVLTREQHSHVRRIVIDANGYGPVVMYIEQDADERMLKICTTLQGIEVTAVDTDAGQRKGGERGIEAEGEVGEEQPEYPEDDVSPGAL